MKTVALRHLSSVPIRNGLGLPGDNADQSDPRYIRTTDIATPTSLKEDTFVSQPTDIAERAPVEYGDLLLVSAGASIGKSYLHLAHDPACYAGFLTRVRPKSLRSGLFLSYWTQSSHYNDQIRSAAVQSTIENFSSARYKELRVPDLSDAQQERIVKFLDTETAKIDHLIAKQQKLLGLTQEQAEANVEAAIWGQSIAREKNDRIAERSYQPRSVLCLAVADRLSAIPESWDVQRFKRIFSRKDDRNIDLSLEMLSLRQTGAVVPRSETNQNQEPSEKSLPKYLAVSPNDLVVNPMWLTGGAIGVSGLSGAVSPDYRVFTIGTDLTPAYAHEILRSISYRRQFKLFERANTTFDRRIQQIDLDNLPVPIPPVEHQKEIVRMVTQIHSYTQKLYEASERSIKLLQERRSALITAAVTGQIEV